MALQNPILIVCCYFLAALYLIAAAVEPCTFPNNPCVCETNTATYNLTSLMKARGGADFTVIGDAPGVDETYHYYVQPCNRRLNTTLPLCASNFVACQLTMTTIVDAYGLGQIDKFTVEGTPENFLLQNYYIDWDNNFRASP